MIVPEILAISTEKNVITLKMTRTVAIIVIGTDGIIGTTEIVTANVTTETGENQSGTDATTVTIAIVATKMNAETLLAIDETVATTRQTDAPVATLAIGAGRRLQKDAAILQAIDAATIPAIGTTIAVRRHTSATDVRVPAARATGMTTPRKNHCRS